MRLRERMNGFVQNKFLLFKAVWNKVSTHN